MNTQLEPKPSSAAWTLLAMLYRAKDGGPPAPTAGFAAERADLLSLGYAVQIGSDIVITAEGRDALETHLTARLTREAARAMWEEARK